MSGEGTVTFAELALGELVLEALRDLGYEQPTPIQAQTIPHLLDGRDLVGQAQTGTGKTAAFALPFLSQIEVDNPSVQGLILAPTRELAIQVCAALERYASKIPGFRAVAIYGGQSFGLQLKEIRRGVQVVVATPGRVMDHMRRGTLQFDELKWLVLDEADEMLRMGFVDDVKWVLEQTPAERQIALFSATMPTPIRRIAQQHLQDPAEITVQFETQTADTIRERFWVVRGCRKGEALVRILEGESVDGMIIFVRTKSMTTEVAERLETAGYRVAPLNGDVPQNLRERTVNQLKAGRLDIIVATDVAARGLDVERISHVINYDLPGDAESYVHRVGRTGRAGRAGEAISFIAGKQKRALREIESTTGQRIQPMDLPSDEQIQARKLERFGRQIADRLVEGNLDSQRAMIEETIAAQGADPIDVAAALAALLVGDGQPPAAVMRASEPASFERTERRPRRERDERPPRGKQKSSRDDRFQEERPRFEKRPQPTNEPGMESFRIQVGKRHGVQPGNIVGAITNEAGLDSQDIGRIQILDHYSIVDLPEGMPREIYRTLKTVLIAGQELRISREGEVPNKPPRKYGGKPQSGKPRAAKPQTGKSSGAKPKTSKPRGMTPSPGEFQVGRGRMPKRKHQSRRDG